MMVIFNFMTPFYILMPVYTHYTSFKLFKIFLNL